MKGFQAIYLWIAVGLLFIGASMPVLAETVTEEGTDDPVTEEGIDDLQDIFSDINYTDIFDPGLDLNFHFLTSMLELLDLNLNLIDELLMSHVSEYPFLQPTIEETETGINFIESVLVVMGSAPEGVNDTNFTTFSFNDSLTLINESLDSPDLMIESANATLGEPQATTPIITEMFESVKGLLSLFA